MHKETSTATIASRLLLRPGAALLLTLLPACALLLPAQTAPRKSTPEQTQAQQPENSSLWTRKYLLGDWDGVRSRLEKKGVVFDFFYTADLLASLSGGYQTANGGFERARGTVDIDFEKMGVAKDLTFHATGVWQAGVNLATQYIGAISNPTSLASAATTRLDSYWIQKGLFSDRLYLRGGQIAGMDLFDLREYGGNFVNEPMGYTPATTVQNTYLPYNPAGTPAAEIRVVPAKNFYVRTAIMAGNRDLYGDDPTGFHFAIYDSPVLGVETGYLVNPEPETPSTKELGRQAATGGLYPGIYKGGATYNPGKFLNPRTGRNQDGNYLIYFQADQAVYRRGREGADAKRGLDLTFQANGSPAEVSKTNFQFDIGARYVGPFASRPKDSINFGYVYSHQSSYFNLPATASAPPLRYGSENLYELNYKSNVLPWLLVQPVVEYIQNPGGRSTRGLGDSFLLGFRTKVEF